MTDMANEKMVTGQGFGTPEPVGCGSGTAGSLRPSASDRSNKLVGDQANSSVAMQHEEEVNPFKRRPNVSRTPPSRERLHPCTDIFERAKKEDMQPKKPETESQRLEREEKLAFEGLGKQIGVIDNIVKDAKNIHKQIREAITGAVIYYQRLKDIRQSKMNLGVLIQNSDEISKEQNDRGPLQKEIAIQTSLGDNENNSTKRGGGKKRGAASPPQEVIKDRRVRPKTQPGPMDIERPEELGKSPKVRRESASEWREVEHRKKNKKKKEQEEGNQKRRTIRRLPEAVVVKPKSLSNSYADVLRNIKAQVDPAALGVNVSKIRQTRGGELLFEIAKGSSNVRELKEAIVQVVGEEATVRNFKRMATIEIMDIDAATEQGEVLDAIKLVAPGADAEHIQIRAMRKTFGETQKAIITVPPEVADTVLKAGKLKIGWIMCRVREKVPVTRCYRCLEPGHLARNCKGPDRSKLCRLCGKEGHFSKQCKEEPLCVWCQERKEPKGSHHIMGSAKCESYRWWTQQNQK